MGGVVAQGLFDGAREQVRIGLDLGQGLGVLVQVIDGAADEMARGLVAAKEQQAELDAQLLLAQGAALVLGRDQGGQEVVARALARARHDIPEVARQVEEALQAGARDVRGQGLGAEHLGDVLGPVQGFAVVVAGHVQGGRDDVHGQGMGELGHAVHATAGRGRVEQGIDLALDERLQGAHHPGQEALGQDLAAHGVRGAVLHEQPGVEDLEELSQLPRGRADQAARQGLAARGREAAAVLEHGHHVVVAGDDPAVQKRRPVHGRAFAQGCVQRIGIIEECRIRGI